MVMEHDLRYQQRLLVNEVFQEHEARAHNS